jgi:hypothetical protein
MADKGWKSYYSMGEEYVEYTDRVTDQEIERDGTKFVYSRWKKPYDCDGADYQEMMHYFWGEYKTKESPADDIAAQTESAIDDMCSWVENFSLSNTSTSYWSSEFACSEDRLMVGRRPL